MSSIKQVEKLPVGYISKKVYDRVIEDFTNSNFNLAKVQMSFFGFTEGDGNYKRVYQSIRRAIVRNRARATVQVIKKEIYLIKS